MVWGCFASNGLDQLTEIHGRMDVKMYRDILDNNLKQSTIKFGIQNNYIFQQDNDPKHTSKLLKSYFAENQIDVLPWPAQSPDLNPIEHLWDELDRQIPQIKRRSFPEFKLAIFERWSEIEVEVLQNLVKSVPRRCKAVLDAKGGPTKY